MRTIIARGLALTLFGLTLIFLIAPQLIVVPISFGESRVLRFPPSGWSLQWHDEALTDPSWQSSAWISFRLALATSIGSTAIGTLSAFGLLRLRRSYRYVRFLLLGPMVVPVVVIGAALFPVMSDMGLVRSFRGLLIAHVIFALPSALLIAEAGLRRLDPDLASAAASLGASPLRTFFRVTLPCISRFIVGSMFYCFIVSWDELVLVRFLGGAANQTLPIKMFEFLETAVTPTLAAVAALLVGLALVALIVVFVGLAIGRRSARALTSTGESELEEPARPPVRAA